VAGARDTGDATTINPATSINTAPSVDDATSINDATSVDDATRVKASVIALATMADSSEREGEGGYSAAAEGIILGYRQEATALAPAPTPPSSSPPRLEPQSCDVEEGEGGWGGGWRPGWSEGKRLQGELQVGLMKGSAG
jgi:hypothetical protein